MWFEYIIIPEPEGVCCVSTDAGWVLTGAVLLFFVCEMMLFLDL